MLTLDLSKPQSASVDPQTAEIELIINTVVWSLVSPFTISIHEAPYAKHCTSGTWLDSIWLLRSRFHPLHHCSQSKASLRIGGRLPIPDPVDIYIVYSDDGIYDYPDLFVKWWIVAPSHRRRAVGRRDEPRNVVILHFVGPLLPHMCKWTPSNHFYF
jgi:hypothetical protein